MSKQVVGGQTPMSLGELRERVERQADVLVRLAKTLGDATGRSLESHEKSAIRSCFSSEVSEHADMLAFAIISGREELVQFSVGEILRINQTLKEL